MVGLDLSGKRVVVVGGNRFAEEKIGCLRGTNAHIVVVAKTLTPNLAQMQASGHIDWIQRSFRRSDPRGCALVIVADDDGCGIRSIRTWCKLWRTLLNVVDQPEFCDLIMPSTLRCGPATVAVSTGGATPAGARFLREEIERLIPERMGELLEGAGQARASLREAGTYRYDYKAWQRDFFEAGLERGDAQSLSEFRDGFVRRF